MTRRTLSERLDDLVRWTGIPALTEQPVRRRPLRWPSTMALVLAGTGFVVAMAHTGGTGRASAIGQAVLLCGFALGNVMKIHGPLKPFGSIEHVDEWDQVTRARAYLFTFAAFAAVTFAGLAVLLAGGAMNWPTDAIGRGAMALFFLLATIAATLPTAHASWTVRWEPAE